MVTNEGDALSGLLPVVGKESRKDKEEKIHWLQKKVFCSKIGFFFTFFSRGSLMHFAN